MSNIHLPTPSPLRIPFAGYSGFNYIKPIRISDSPRLTDYQIKIELNGNNFDLGRLRPDANDIRLIDTDGGSLDFWLESISSTSATVWSKIPEIPAGEDKYIWLVYGNPSANSASNGMNTFEFFDDFNSYLPLFHFNRNVLGFTDNTGHFVVEPADIDEDGEYEFILFNTGAGGTLGEDKIVVVDNDGVTKLWEATTGLDPTYGHHPFIMSPCYGNVDPSKEGLEIAHGITSCGTGHDEQGGVQLLDKDGNQIWLKQDYRGVDGICVDDVDGDGNDEVVVLWHNDAYTTRRCVVYNESGTIILDRDVSSGTLNGSYECWGYDMGMYTADIDGDGKAEIFIPGGNDGQFKVIKYDGTDDGTELWNVPYISEDNHGDDVCWADIDDDGKLELFITIGDRAITARQHDGTEIWSKSGYQTHLQVVDIVKNTNEDKWYLYILEKFSDKIIKIDANSGNEIWAKLHGGSSFGCQFGVADLDGDGNEEIIYTDSTNTKIIIFDNDLNVILENGISAVCDIGKRWGEIGQGDINDVDKDGHPEIFTNYGAYPNSNDLYIYRYSDLKEMGLDSSRWTSIQGVTELTEEGSLHCDDGVVQSINTYSYNHRLKIRAKNNNIRNFGMGFIETWGTWNNNIRFWQSTVKQTITESDNVITSEDDMPADLTIYHNYEMLWKSGEAKFLCDSLLQTTHVTNVPTGSYYITLAGMEGDVGAEAWFDWVFLSKYISPEPTVEVL